MSLRHVWRQFIEACPKAVSWGMSFLEAFLKAVHWGMSEGSSLGHVWRQFLKQCSKQPMLQASSAPSNQYSKQALLQASNAPIKQYFKQEMLQASNAPSKQLPAPGLHKVPSIQAVLGGSFDFWVFTLFLQGKKRRQFLISPFARRRLKFLCRPGLRHPALPLDVAPFHSFLFRSGPLWLQPVLPRSI